MNLPLLLEPTELAQHLDNEQLRIVDLCKAESYAQVHVPGAVYLDYKFIIGAQPPVMGLLPDEATFAVLLTELGISPQTHVVAYDDEGGGKAARLLYTLEAFGHKNFSLLNGGINAWYHEKHPLENTPNQAKPADSNYPVSYKENIIADRQYILDHLGDTQVQLLDARSDAEFSGMKKFAERGGHIPGAVNLDWMALMDTNHYYRLKPDAELKLLLRERGISPDNTIVTYCQTHHRSALTYFALKHLGFDKIRGYPGSWSDWGNQADTPIEN